MTNATPTGSVCPLRRPPKGKDHPSASRTAFFGLPPDSRNPSSPQPSRLLDSPHHHADVGLADEKSGLDRLAALVYDELHRMARHYMQDERTGNTLQTTALVNEVYLRLVDVRNVDWQQRPSLGCTAASAGGNLKMSQPCPASTERNSSTSRKNARSASGSLL